MLRHDLEARGAQGPERLISVRSRLGRGWVTTADSQRPARLGSPGTTTRTSAVPGGTERVDELEASVFDVRDLEVPAERGDWGAAPDAVRAACALLVSLVALAVLRAWMVLAEWPEFLRVYGRDRAPGHGIRLPAGRWPSCTRPGSGARCSTWAWCWPMLPAGPRRAAPGQRVPHVRGGAGGRPAAGHPGVAGLPRAVVLPGGDRMLALAALTLVLLLLRRRTCHAPAPGAGNLHESLPVQRAQPPRPAPPTWPESLKELAETFRQALPSRPASGTSVTHQTDTADIDVRLVGSAPWLPRTTDGTSPRCRCPGRSLAVLALLGALLAAPPASSGPGRRAHARAGHP